MSNLVRCKDRFTYLSSERIGTLLVYSLIGNHIKKGIVHVTTWQPWFPYGTAEIVMGR